MIMAALPQDTLLKILLGKTEDQRGQIQTEAEAVVFGFSTSISSLSQSGTFDVDAAAQVLTALQKVTEMLAADEEAEAADVPESTLGHMARFQPVKTPQGVTWGC